MLLRVEILAPESQVEFCRGEGSKEANSSKFKENISKKKKKKRKKKKERKSQREKAYRF